MLWLGADDVASAMPPLEERLRLAELTMTALARPGASELPPKIGIHPRPADSFVHAMPAHLRAGDAVDDLVGMKWVAGFPTNNAAGTPAISAVVVLNDAATGVPVAILDGAPITAQRTAAVSGVAIRHFGPAAATAPAPQGSGGATIHAAVIGTGVQGRSHLPILGGVLPGCTLHVFDRHPERAEALADVARATEGVAEAVLHDSARATVVPVDYATYCAAEVPREAALFLVDHRDQFLANRAAGLFDGYPEPADSLGGAILAGTPRPEGRVVITHLGVGLADLVFADAILRNATAAGLGTTLRR